ncbi:hypothetical protein ABT324_33165 [Saccharopolyspora sp. NPDC000359]|uniref:hypothetical protein n=1 Tax=Saccharopolyspora sp. NPDC000359 TaxID=3154251 RepID=UPI0033280BF5
MVRPSGSVRRSSRSAASHSDVVSPPSASTSLTTCPASFMWNVVQWPSELV